MDEAQDPRDFRSRNLLVVGFAPPIGPFIDLLCKHCNMICKNITRCRVLNDVLGKIVLAAQHTVPMGLMAIR